MNQFLGADTEQLRAHACLLTRSAHTVLEMQRRLEPLVMDEAMWRGPDAESFRGQWRSAAWKRLDRGAGDLRGRATLLDRQAEEQDEVSGTLDGPIPTAPGPGGGSGDHAPGSPAGPGQQPGAPFHPVQFLMEQAAKAQSGYSKLKKMIDFLGRIPSAADEYAALLQKGVQGLWRHTYLQEVFEDGKEWQKGAEKLLGKLGIPYAAGNWEPLKVLNKLDEVAPWLSTAGKGIGRALPWVDIVDGGRRLFTEDTSYGRVSGGLQTAGGALLLAAPFLGPAAPLVGAVGAGLSLVSIGMDVTKAVQDNWDSIEQTGQDIAEGVWTGVGNVAEGVRGVGDAVASGIGGLGDALGL
ncbi:hypothetical protein JSY14_03725 [Brachybacterium sp. EF45031]|uniref:hypothetical protein n=1 Tax=Brachybacterium sillae TaxID=2810536 RepID=UPI00217E058F|nr:hypothetical protein [Brachybacterium sillae]MCS6711166.1 hypothetical protein [Brachybacterium sillae]